MGINRVPNKPWPLVALILAYCVGPTFSQDTLESRLNGFGKAFGDGQISEQQLEEEHLKLGDVAKSPKERGKILAHLTDDLAMRPKKKNADMIIKYANAALENPLDVLDAIRMNRRVGEGMGLKYRESKGKEWADARRGVVVPMLHGLRIVLDNLTTTDKHPLPAVSPFTCDGSRGCEQLQEENKREIAERARVNLQNHLVDAKTELIQACILEYTHYRKDALPPDPSQLDALAKEILGPQHQDVIVSISEAVAKGRAEREQRDKAQREQTKREQSTFPPKAAGGLQHSKQAKQVQQEAPR